MGEFQAMLLLINSDPIVARNHITVGLKMCWQKILLEYFSFNTITRKANCDFVNFQCILDIILNYINSGLTLGQCLFSVWRRRCSHLAEGLSGSSGILGSIPNTAPGSPMVLGGELRPHSSSADPQFHCCEHLRISPAQIITWLNVKD